MKKKWLIIALLMAILALALASCEKIHFGIDWVL
jgi:hypothetical protein